MKLLRRKHGSQRPMASIKLECFPQFVGQGGAACIVFKGEDDIWYSILPESEDDVRLLMSQSHVAHHNWRD